MLGTGAATESPVGLSVDHRLELLHRRRRSRMLRTSLGVGVSVLLAIWAALMAISLITV